MKAESMTIQMKNAEQFFRFVLFVIPYNVFLTLESVDDILGVTIPTKPV